MAMIDYEAYAIVKAQRDELLKAAEAAKEMLDREECNLPILNDAIKNAHKFD